MERKIGDRVVIEMQYGEETVEIFSIDCDENGYDVRDDSGIEFWISANDVLRTVEENRATVVVLSDRATFPSTPNSKKVLTRLTIKGSSSWSGIGYVATGDSARKEMNGPLVAGPWAYGYPLSHVLDNHGGTGAEQDALRAAGLLIEVNGGELFEIDGTRYEVVVVRRGRDAWVDFKKVEA